MCIWFFLAILDLEFLTVIFASFVIFTQFEFKINSSQSGNTALKNRAKNHGAEVILNIEILTVIFAYFFFNFAILMFGGCILTFRSEL